LPRHELIDFFNTFHWADELDGKAFNEYDSWCSFVDHGLKLQNRPTEGARNLGGNDLVDLTWSCLRRQGRQNECGFGDAVLVTPASVRRSMKIARRNSRYYREYPLT
jgi:hypothetical protein